MTKPHTNKPYVLITRPSPEGEQLLARLRAVDIPACHTPLTDFHPGKDLPQLPELLNSLQPDDLIIALSPRAVNYAAHYLQQWQLTWPQHIHYLAIGKSSASRLKEASGQLVLTPAGAEISENLLQLPLLQQVKGKQVLLLRGNGGRRLLADTLRFRGASIIRCECYLRSPLCYDGTQLAIDWQRQGINTLLITSGETLRQLFSLVPVSMRYWLLSCRLLVVSERIKALARQMGWQEISVAESADNDALIRHMTAI